MSHFDVIIIGAGAAGLMCAAEANRRGRRVLLLDQSEEVGRKIFISGGGRCNFTNLYASPDNFLSENHRFCVSALARYTQHDFISLVDQYEIEWHQRDHGQLFCLGPAKQIIDMLLAEAKGVDIQTAVTVKTVAKSEAGPFEVKTDRGDFSSEALVIATGGPSIPKMGSSTFGYQLAKQFGLKLIEPRAGLVPLTFDAETLARLDGLSGVSVDATVTHGKIQFTEGLLFTHRGLSGPVILQISSYWRPGDTITVNLLPEIDLFEYLKDAKQGQPKKDVVSILGTLLPARLAQRMTNWSDSNGRLADMPDKTLQRLADHINRWQVTPDGSQGLRTAEVTVGGVDTNELSSQTMEARSVPGLYFIGECVDVTGHLGGFNFQWAWASGHVCGQVV
ncbi:MAG: aminoacetone oxidase family FAD-binding enzyme [Alphaproteobacteria bacterium]|nr:aminoacetone oxidase family FAD-binding enzyme [Alphaproteobacteria bacterium]